MGSKSYLKGGFSSPGNSILWISSNSLLSKYSKQDSSWFSLKLHNKKSSFKFKFSLWFVISLVKFVLKFILSLL